MPIVEFKLSYFLPSALGDVFSTEELATIRDGFRQCDRKPGARDVSWSEWLVRTLSYFGVLFLWVFVVYIASHYFDLRICFSVLLRYEISGEGGLVLSMMLAVLVLLVFPFFVSVYLCNEAFGAIPSFATSTEHTANALAFFSSAPIAAILAKHKARYKLRTIGRSGRCEHVHVLKIDKSAVPKLKEA
jgi:hypothetical protein